ncbi:MAG TPA: arginine--tRNA ligase [Elusimicrobia bacterium]|nr:arginine--tRNA ligase [Elusimicrobiota bacterium]
MKLSALEAELKERAARAFKLSADQTAAFSLSAPPPHIRADISIAWPISAAKLLKRPPLKIAEELAAVLSPDFEAGVIAPGFVNINLKTEILFEALRDIISGPAYFNNPARAGQKINLEFVSANPTGPLHLASGRGATLGDSLVKILRLLGAGASSEFYVNNMGRQVDLLGRSLKARFEGTEPPEDGYKGAYLKDIAAAMSPEASGWTEKQFSEFAVARMLLLHKADMSAFGVEFDRWFLESELHAADAPRKALEALKSRGMAYEKEGAVWFGGSSEMSSDDKDRVLVKSDGRNTYFLNDIAYHLNKYDRGFNLLIDIWGADHHGYVPRMEAAVSALGKTSGAFKVIIHQMVILKRGEALVKMSKREGDFISLKELVEEVGADACRFFFAMRGPNTHLIFDIDLAKKRSNENPVYYVQYVHARICSIFANAAEKGVDVKAGFEPAEITFNPEERALALKLLWFEKTLETCAGDFSPHYLTTYLTELSALFHSFYTKHKVLVPEEPQTTAMRLFLLKAVKAVISEGLGLLGVSSPEKM